MDNHQNETPKTKCCDFEENHKLLWKWDKHGECWEPDLVVCEVCKRIVEII